MIRLRQVAFVARDLRGAVDQVRSSLGLELAYEDPSVAMFGLKNAVFPLGGPERPDFLEIVSPVTGDSAAARYLDRRGGDSGYMLIFECDDMAAARAAVERLGIRIVQEFGGGDHLSLHLHPRDCGGVLLSLDSTAGEWAAAGPDWRAHVRTDVTRRLRAVEVAVESPTDVLSHWAELTGSTADGGVLHLDNADLRIRKAASDDEVGVVALQVERGPAWSGATDLTDFCGVRLQFVEPRSANS